MPHELCTQFCVLFVYGCRIHSQPIHVTYVPIFFIVASLALGQSWDFPGISEVALRLFLRYYGLHRMPHIWKGSLSVLQGNCFYTCVYLFQKCMITYHNIPLHASHITYHIISYHIVSYDNITSYLIMDYIIIYDIILILNLAKTGYSQWLLSCYLIWY